MHNLYVSVDILNLLKFHILKTSKCKEYFYVNSSDNNFIKYYFLYSYTFLIVHNISSSYVSFNLYNALYSLDKYLISIHYTPKMEQHKECLLYKTKRRTGFSKRGFKAIFQIKGKSYFINCSGTDICFCRFLFYMKSVISNKKKSKIKWSVRRGS